MRRMAITVQLSGGPLDGQTHEAYGATSFPAPGGKYVLYGIFDGIAYFSFREGQPTDMPPLRQSGVTE